MTHNADKATILRDAAVAIRIDYADVGEDQSDPFMYAVADWLDGVAIHLEAREDDEWLDLDGDPIAPEDTHAIGSALAVARAYLAPEQEGGTPC